MAARSFLSSRPAPARLLSAAVLLALGGLTGSASAQRAAYAQPSDLPGEGLPHALDLALLGTYARPLAPSRLSGLSSVGTAEIRTRALVGRTLAWAGGLDGQIGASDEGLAYGAALYPVGLGTRWGAGNAITLVGGGAIDAVGTAIPPAVRVPVELSLAIDAGPVRPVVWVRPAWIVREQARQNGFGETPFDELEAGALVRLARQHRYWTRTSAGGGVALGVTYRRLMDADVIGISLGFAFAGER